MMIRRGAAIWTGAILSLVASPVIRPLAGQATPEATQAMVEQWKTWRPGSGRPVFGSGAETSCWCEAGVGPGVPRSDFGGRARRLPGCTPRWHRGSASAASPLNPLAIF